MALSVTIRSKRRGEREILRDLRFEVPAGGVLAVMGPSGCGKTTLLGIIAGIDADFDGEVRTQPGARIGTVFQEPRLLPWRSVRDNLLLVLPDSAQTELVDALLDEVGLAGATAMWPRQLSLGMARRVAVARALAIQPDILLLDEPFASLDVQAAERLAVTLRLAMQRRPHLATLLVTHDPQEASLFGAKLLPMA